MKTCCRCEQAKSLAEFGVRNKTPDGLSYSCRVCESAYMREYQQKNKEILRTERIKWEAKNLDKYREYRKQHREKLENKVRRNLWARAHYEKNREALRAKLTYAASVRRAAGKIDFEWWQALINLFEFKNCLYCGNKVEKFVMDHYIPVARGGKTEIGNLIPVCRRCNCRKCDTHPEKFFSPQAKVELDRFLAATKEAWEEYEHENAS